VPFELVEESQELEQKALSWSQQANEVKIVDQESYDRAAELLKVIKDLRAKAEEHHRPMIKAAHESHKAACAGLARIDMPLEHAEATVKTKAARFLDAVRQEELRRQREAEAEARRIEQERLARARELEAAGAKAREEELEREIEAREAAGAGEAELAEVIEQHHLMAPLIPLMDEMPAAVPVIAPLVTRNSGAALTYNYEVAVDSLPALVSAAAQNPAAYIQYLQPNEKALGAAARTQKESFRVPGCRLKKAANVRTRR
jgi:hypothetical protein